MSGPSQAHGYSSLKYALALAESLYLALLLFAFQASGLSRLLALGVSGNVFAYTLIAFLGYRLLDLPLDFCQSFYLEHRFALSRQKVVDWFLDQIKSSALACAVLLVFVAAFYCLLARFPSAWWLALSGFWIFFSLILAKVAPLLVIPLFFKHKKLNDEALRQRIMGLAQKMGVKLLDVFEIDFSKKTLKANAAFVGIGSTRRVLLADTLKEKYTQDEIEVILAHEFAHYKLRHLPRLIMMHSSVTLLLFYLVFKTSGAVLGFFGEPSLASLSALPVVFMYFLAFGFVMQPLSNSVSRAFEKSADRMALEATGLRGAFISAFEKLARQNLADRSPHPLIKFFFFDHPPIDERIMMAKDKESA